MKLFTLLAFAVGSFAFGSSAEGLPAAYAKKVSFQKGRPLRFPDFVLEYAGERRVASKQYPRGFLNHDFIVTTGSERRTVSWSAGTGDIGPAPFTIAGKDFALELARSDSLGKLKPNELVITIRRR